MKLYVIRGGTSEGKGKGRPGTCLMIVTDARLLEPVRQQRRTPILFSGSRPTPLTNCAGTMAARSSCEGAMLDLVDLLLLRRGIPADDRALTFRRIDGDRASNVIYFLPWHTPCVFAQHAGFAPIDFLACYEMPNAIVSSEPELCVQAMLGLVQDAERLLIDRGNADDLLIVGLSVGSYPATYLANRIGARLCSVASADRGDLAIWESPATRIIRRRAVHKGYRLSHYTDAFLGTHPAENLRGIRAGSIFVMGDHDPFVPFECKAGLLRAIETHSPGAHVVRLSAGHFKTMVASGRYQRRMLGVEHRNVSRLRMPSLSLPQLSVPRSATERQ
jgi:hypothetical protein